MKTRFWVDLFARLLVACARRPSLESDPGYAVDPRSP
jgi:hypothetical protein